ncbi:signal-transduction protein [Thermoproteus uzoniensis 768-20]|uniref:Signal-transduction protein n=1 Tax=Thermoproteus uzoniensis (strain 768-20) TaxID=999630 RepID=F2L5Y6_THEU7|nr:CBS domain-containing protein [Thermoproteus uzoniensis]AEA12431.1 signal-transduction protein [Thermoproteus uzoniensis 768-20]
MKVGAIASRPPITAEPGITIREAASIMAKRRIGLLVLVEGGRLYGVVSERDIVRAVAAGLSPERPAALIATRDVVTIDAESDVLEAARLMARRGIRHLVVVKGGELYGVVSVRDIVREAAQLAAAAAGPEEAEHAMAPPAD